MSHRLQHRGAAFLARIQDADGLGRDTHRARRPTNTILAHGARQFEIKYMHRASFAVCPMATTLAATFGGVSTLAIVFLTILALSAISFRFFESPARKYILHLS